MKQKQENYANNYKNYYKLREVLLEEQKKIKKAEVIIEKYLKKEKLYYSDAEYIYKLLGYDIYKDLQSVIIADYY